MDGRKHALVVDYLTIPAIMITLFTAGTAWFCGIPQCFREVYCVRCAQSFRESQLPNPHCEWLHQVRRRAETKDHFRHIDLQREPQEGA